MSGGSNAGMHTSAGQVALIQRRGPKSENLRYTAKLGHGVTTQLQEVALPSRWAGLAAFGRRLYQDWAVTVPMTIRRQRSEREAL